MPPARPTDAISQIKVLFERLAAAHAAPKPPPKPKPAPYVESFPGSNVHIYNYDYFYSTEPTLGQEYGEKLSLSPRQITWLDKFHQSENNAFLNVESVREATLLLYLVALSELDRQLKAAGTTVAKQAKALEEEASRIAYSAGFWYDTDSRGGKAGTDSYLAIFRLCEGALRQHYSFSTKNSKLFPRKLAELEPIFQRQLGQRVMALLPALLPHVPPPDVAAERTFNRHTPNRWKTEFAQLVPLLPAKVPAFEKALGQLLRLNDSNPTLESIHFEAAKLLAKTDREAALHHYLHYLHNGNRWVHRTPKTLPKILEKILFPEPEHAQRFQQIVALLKLSSNRKAALEKVATVYVRERRKIDLDRNAVQSARAQHSDTVELLNEYLQEETAPPANAANAAAKPPTKPVKAATKVSVGTSNFVGGLGLTAPQQALLQLFAGRQLTLPQAEAEALAQRLGTLRNQLIDSLNDACYELLNDVLIEETDDNYTIYAPYFQKISGK